MDFAWNTQKNKMTDVKGLEKEQNREGRISNQDIDLTKTYLNYDLVKSDLNLYQRVKKRVDEVRDISRIQKNSVVDFSNIITVSNKDYENWGLDKTKDYLKNVYEYFCFEFGKENVVSAKVHLDETTPHMHLHFVPVSPQNGKLQARSVMTPARINKVHSEAPRYLQERGFNVSRGKGVTGKDNIQSIHEFKKDKLRELENNINAIKMDLESFVSVQDVFKDINLIEAEKTILGGKIKLKQGDYQKIISGYEKSLVENIDLSKKNKELTSKNEKLIKDLNKLNKKVKSFDYGLLDFEKKKEKLKNKLRFDLKNENESEMNDLKNENEKLKLENEKLKSKSQGYEKELKIFYREHNIKSLDQKNNFFRKIKNRNMDLER